MYERGRRCPATIPFSDKGKPSRGRFPRRRRLRPHRSLQPNNTRATRAPRACNAASATLHLARSFAAYRKRTACASSSSRRPGKNIAASSDSLKSPPPAVTYEVRMRSSCPSWFFCIRKIIRESVVSRMRLIGLKPQIPCRLSLRLVLVLFELRKRKGCYKRWTPGCVKMG